MILKITALLIEVSEIAASNEIFKSKIILSRHNIRAPVKNKFASSNSSLSIMTLELDIENYAVEHC